MNDVIHWALTLELINNDIMVLGPRILSGVLIAAVILWRPHRWWRMLFGGVFGAGALVIVGIVLEDADAFDGPLPGIALVWIAWAGAGVGIGLVGIMSRPWPRRVLGSILLICALLVGSIGVNRAYGVTHTLAAILGVQTIAAAPLPTKVADDPADDDSSQPLYERWQAPAGMPSKGRVSALSGSQQIPKTSFDARDGALYLPPAALVANPPDLPVIVFMMGQPGSPDPTALASALDAFAAAHQGLAPIGVIVDQLGAATHDPVCVDSQKYGAVSTYINKNVPAYIRAHLNVSTNISDWVIGGYSNGGSCALAFGATHPEVWGGILDVSGNEYPGSEHVDRTVKELFGGDKNAFTATIPTNVFATKRGAYAGHVAVFTHGSNDTTFGPGQVRNAQAARAVGFTVLESIIDGAGHTGTALGGGLTAGINQIAPSLGLAAP